MLEALLDLLLLAVAVFAIAKLLPAIHLKGFGTAIAVAIVYSIVNFLFGWLLYLVGLPFILITFGLFKIVINAILLWLTDKLLPDFEIKGFGWTIVAAALIAVTDTLLQRLLS